MYLISLDRNLMKYQRVDGENIHIFTIKGCNKRSLNYLFDHCYSNFLIIEFVSYLLKKNKRYAYIIESFEAIQRIVKKKFLSYCSLTNLIVYCISSILTNPITIKCVPFNRIIFSSNLYREKSLPNSEISCSCQLTIAIEIALFRSGFYRATNRQRDSCNELVADFIKTKIAFVISTNTG